MNKKVFIDNYKRFKMSKMEIEMCINTIVNFETFISKDINDTTIEDVKNYVDHLVREKKNTYNNLIHIARYYYYIDMKKEYIHMTKYFNTIGVLESIIDRINLYEGKEVQAEFLKNVTLPVLGTESESLPVYTKEFMDKLSKHIPKSSCNTILAGNNHNIPKESFEKEKIFYKNSKSLETYLKDRHSRKIQELQEHYDENKVWFEQIITEDAIDFVKNNQEVLSATLENEKLYVTKIPYNLNKYLSEKDDTLKRYYACHCSFVRESIKDCNVDIPKEWCYCSGGFAKFPFEVILDTELQIKLLKTPIDGDYVCRFEIDLSNVEYKK